MKNFPLIIVDNFYNNPLNIKKIATNQIYSETKKGNYPGFRTKSINEFDISLFNYFCTKLFSIFYDFSLEEIKWKVNTCFDLIKKDSLAAMSTDGFIHTDSNMKMAGLVYLNENLPNNTGTNFYIKKNISYNDDKNIQTKVKFFNDKSFFPDYKLNLKNHNSNFQKTIQIENIFNRLIAYDPEIYHANGDLSNLTEDRLIQVFHVEELNCKKTPLKRWEQCLKN